MNKRSCGRKGFILAWHLVVNKNGGQGRNLETQTEAKNMLEGSSQTPVHGGLGQKPIKYSIDLPTGQFMDEISQLIFPLLR